MRALITILVTAALVIAGLTGEASSGNTSPGSKCSFASAQLISLPGKGQLGPVLTGTIAKGRRHHVLVADVMLNGANHGGSPTQYLVALEVNGVRMEPSTDAPMQIDAGQSTGAAHPCAFAGTWWLDLDDAEGMFPGAFAHKLLTIKVLAADVVNDGFQSPTDVVTQISLAARMEEK